MSVSTMHCPRCGTPLPASDTEECPQCRRAVWDVPTRTLRDLNTTTDFRVQLSEAASDELLDSQFSNYWIERFLGQGGMARVYRARHLTLERPCAIKILKSSRDELAERAVGSFLAEARAAAALVHPHVVTIHTIGHERGWHFIEMEYVEGCSLASTVEREGPLPIMEATRLLVQVGSALARAHACGMVHRDIKPSNVLITADRIAKLADFGLAKTVRSQARDECSVLTGTPNYMAPELFAGEPAGTRSDVYAMGVTYFQLLTGRLPYSGDSLGDLIRQQRQASPPDIQLLRPEVPDLARRIIHRCLETRAEERYEDATELLVDLSAAYGSLRSLECLLRESLQNAPVTLTGAGEQFVAIVQLPAGRRQTVTIEIRDSGVVAEQVIRVASICGRADERHFLRALQFNPESPYGAVGIEKINGDSYFVMTNVYPRCTCDPEEIRYSVLGIAQHADDAERWLSEDDVH